MTENLIKNAMHAIKTMDHSREAALRRLQRAGILTKSGKMTALYRLKDRFYGRYLFGSS